MNHSSFFARLLRFCSTHIRLILSCVLIVFLILDRFNPSMEFIGNDATKIFIAVLSLLTLISTVAEIVRSPKKR